MKPCPFCRHDIVKLDSWPVNDHREYAGVCQNCGAQGPNDLGASGAMEMWEMRRSEDTLQAEVAALRQRLQAVEGQRDALEAEVAALRARVAELAAALREAIQELERLHYIHMPVFEGKLGEPDLEIIAQARAALARAEAME